MGNLEVEGDRQGNAWGQGHKGIKDLCIRGMVNFDHGVCCGTEGGLGAGVLAMVFFWLQHV